MVYIDELGTAKRVERYQPISNIRSNGGRCHLHVGPDGLDLDLPDDSTKTACITAGCVVGAALTYWILKNINNPVS